MQYALQDLRRVGVHKILSGYDDDWFEVLRQCNNSLYDIKSSSYSFLRSWRNVREALQKNYDGMYRFVLSAEPLIHNLSVEDKHQRRFRNQWNSAWHSLAKDMSLPKHDEEILRDLGIRLGYFANADKNILSFYNSMLYWYIFTSNEANIRAVNVEPFYLIELMVTLDQKAFLEKLKSFI